MEKGQKHSLSIGGFARVRILENGKVVGDSGLVGPNRITQTGLDNFLVKVMMGSAGSRLISFGQLGTGTAPATNSTRLHGEITDNSDSSYDAVSQSTLTASDGVTLRWYGTFESANSFVTKSWNISNIGLYNATTSNDSLACGQTYGSSQVSTNQDVQYTYEWQIDTTT